MRKILIIEDDKNRINQFKKNFKNVNITFTNTVKGTIDILSKNKKFDIIFFDHDLGDGGDSVNIAKWLSQHTDKLPKNVYVHSANPVGANNIIGYIKYARKIPMVWKKEIQF